MSLRALKFPLDTKLTLSATPAPFLESSWIEDISSDSESALKPPLSITQVQTVCVDQSTTLTCGKNVKEKIEFLLNVEDFNCSYLPGDTIGIYPINPFAEVESLLELLDLKESANKYFRIDVLKFTSKKNAAVPKHLPRISTLLEIFLKYLEIRSPLKKLFLRSLSSCTVDDNERRRLEELSSKEGSDDYNKYILSDNTTLLTILKEFRTCKPPFCLLLEHLPGIRPRIYSIASSPLLHSKHIRIVVTIVENYSGGKGICSGYLYDLFSKSDCLENKLELLNISNDPDQLQHSLKVSMFFRQPNNFRFPKSLANLILIGAGSGIAPFIGFLEHKAALESSVSSSFETWLFFGCRNENDYLYRKELQHFLDKRILTKLFVSFSRIPVINSSPKYVQDSITSVKEEFINLLTNAETYLYICGDARNMMKEVISTIKSCLKSVKEIDETEADTQIEDLIKSGLIITDSWL